MTEIYKTLLENLPPKLVSFSTAAANFSKPLIKFLVDRNHRTLTSLKMGWSGEHPLVIVECFGYILKYCKQLTYLSFSFENEYQMNLFDSQLFTTMLTVSHTIILIEILQCEPQKVHIIMSFLPNLKKLVLPDGWYDKHDVSSLRCSFPNVEITAKDRQPRVW